ncbi:protein FAM177B [Rattus norvegicus]|uniref:protein FAM177B n=1 Tax=Rattus norvegicus TaxID=10116 RepID=UPI0004E49050
MSRSYDNTTPKRIIYFADGDVTGECGTEEDEDRAADTWPSSAIDSVASSTYSAFQLVGSTFGGRFAAFFGLTEPKHQCGLNEHPRTQTKVDGVLPGPPRALRPEGYFAS